MDFSNIDTDVLISEMEAKRLSLNLSYQNVADACDVSQATIIRILKGKTAPTLPVLQKIAYAVKYEPRREENLLTGYTQDDYIRYLQRTIEIQKEEHAIEKGQLEAQFNKRHNEDRRAFLIATVLASVLVIFVCGMFAYDFAHLDRGWIQAQFANYTSGIFDNATATIREWFKNVCSV